MAKANPRFMIIVILSLSILFGFKYFKHSQLGYFNEYSNITDEPTILNNDGEWMSCDKWTEKRFERNQNKNIYNETDIFTDTFWKERMEIARNQTKDWDDYLVRKQEILEATSNTIIGKPNLCNDGHTKKIIFVKSRPESLDRRDAIRKTYGEICRKLGIPVIFILGIHNDFNNSQIISEDKEHGDILQAHFIDSRGNLTLKTFIMIYFLDQYCPKVDLTISTDDDMYLNIRRVLVSNYLCIPNSIIGFQYVKAPIFRLKGHKYYVPSTVYPFKYYPDYFPGWLYFLTKGSIKKLKENIFQLLPALKVDVYLGGILAVKSGLKRFPLNWKLSAKWNSPNIAENGYCSHCNVFIVGHDLSVDDMFQIHYTVTRYNIFKGLMQFYSYP